VSQPDEAAGRASRGRRRSPAERRSARAAVDDPDVVMAAGLRFLEARPRSIAETRRRLVQMGYRADLVDATVERLTDLGLLDDAEFARSWVESRDRAHPRGERALRNELRLKGLPDAVIAEALAARSASGPVGPGGAAITDGSDPDEAAARRLLARRAVALGRLQDPRERRRRAYGLLVRHGFSPELAGRIAAETDAAVDEPEDGFD
jgi:regulatory protein